MTAAISFTKMQGIGNDYVYINGFKEDIAHPAELCYWLGGSLAGTVHAGGHRLA